MGDAQESPTLRLRRMDAATQELAAVLREHRILTLFQPIVDPRNHSVYGHEALSRGPSDSWLHAPVNLFEAARRGNIRSQLEFECIDCALTRFAATGEAGRLFINVSPDMIVDGTGLAERLQQTAERCRFPLNRCVIELTEEHLIDDYRHLRTALERMRVAGCEIAIDDLGAGRSGLRTWSELRPDFVKIDRYFVSNVDSDDAKLGFVRSIVDMARAIGCRVIAEGVETLEEARELQELGIDYLQGYYFARPEAAIQDAAERIATLERSAAIGPALTAGHLVETVEPVPPEMRVADLVALFRAEPQFEARAVVRDGKPLGIVRRDALFSMLSRPLYPEIYNKKPVATVMESPTLVVESRLRLEQASWMVTRRARAHVTDQFVIAREGQYLGIGHTMDLLRHITEQQVQTARLSNPLTLLPGNGPIRECLSRLLAQQRRFVACYVDLDAFKPYNDCYGYNQGDQMILHLASLMKGALSSRQDFIGHVGGDDFVIVLRSTDWRQRLLTLVSNFSATLHEFYTEEHVASGGFVGVDRSGVERRLPLMTLSLGAVDSSTPGCTSADSIAAMLAEVKKLAKARDGNALVFRGPEGDCELLSEPGAIPSPAIQRRRASD